MIASLVGDVTIVHVVVALLVGLGVGWVVALMVKAMRSEPRKSVKRIMFPFTGNAISRRALDSAFRLAKAEDAILVPAYLATVPLRLALEAPLPVQCEGALPLLDTIEQKGLRYGVRIDSRIEKGRSPRDAIRRLIAEEDFDRVVVPASAHGDAGFSADDVAWILSHVEGEVVVIRAAQEDEKVLAGATAA